MQKVLQQGAGKRDNEMRRSLAYLYGTLGKAAQKTGKKTSAINYYKNAATTWQSLIDKDGKNNEYSEGLKWSNDRAQAISE